MVVYPQGHVFTREEIQKQFNYCIYIDEKHVATSNCLQKAEEYFDVLDKTKHVLEIYNGLNDGTDQDVAKVGILSKDAEHRYSKHTAYIDHKFIPDSFILQHSKPWVPYQGKDLVPYAFYIYRVQVPSDYLASIVMEKIEGDHRIEFEVSGAHQYEFSDDMQEAWMAGIKPGQENIFLFGINQNSTACEFIQFIDDYDEWEFAIDVPPSQCPVPL